MSHIRKHALQLRGISWVGVNVENGRKLLLSLVFLTIVLLVGKALKAIFGKVTTGIYDSGI